MKTTIGNLIKGEYFLFEDTVYKVGHVVNNTSGYVACTDTMDRHTKRLSIDLEVERCDTITCSNKDEALKCGNSMGWDNVLDWEYLKGTEIKLIVKPQEEQTK